MYATESKKRRPRFSNAELAMLVNEVYRNKEVLFSKKCSTYSNEQKSRAWQAVTDSINGVCLVEPRTPEEVRRKWYYYLSDKKKETARQKAQKKTSNASPNILYSSTDLKILEILGEIDSGEAEGDDDNGVEGLICEVDADALPLRSPSSVNGDNISSDEQKFLTSVAAELNRDHPAGGMVNGFAGSIHIEATKRDSGPLFANDCYSPSYRQGYNSRRRPRDPDEDDLDINSREFLHLEKRRLMLQECQLEVLQNIQRQMQEDAERNRMFQEAILDLHRQRLELKRESLRIKKKLN
ncbi:myb/SANT-like DNA-binding domain-containing protein 4 [Macrobrachium rosenbergii]|uniref:myb/SANT-like DNA-binding domain-containing protein 4 n=1 Tax=Macrobrachium rosenbergii TaxID=79674 RepID=UPI0034D59EBF